MEMCQQLLYNGAKINVADLIMAAEYNYPEILKLLLEQNATNINERNKNGDTALTMAATYGKAKIMKILLEAGANVNLQATNSVVPFAFWIIWNRQYDILEMLLDRGMDLSTRSIQTKMNALDYAARYIV